MDATWVSDCGKVALYLGDCATVLPQLEAESFETCLTDPPYGLSFMGKDWDHGVPGEMFWKAAQRVLKPGAMLLAFGGTRTFHRLTCAIEDAGFEIRDCLMWLYGSGFPKSLDISKAIDKAAGAEREVVGKSKTCIGPSMARTRPAAIDVEGNNWETANVITAPATDLAKLWNGWGTALKPAWEPIILAMKPLDGTFAENAQAHGVAGLNIDGGRIGSGEGRQRTGETTADARYTARGGTNFAMKPGPRGGDARGRWPANLLLDQEAAELLDLKSGERKSGGLVRGTEPSETGQNGIYGRFARVANEPYADSGGASRFFYCAKASRSDRGEGNSHPTVKPTSLMEYLCNLTATPEGGTVLDCFMGSGTTGLAAIASGRKFVGIELEEESFGTAVDRCKKALRDRSELLIK